MENQCVEMAVGKDDPGCAAREHVERALRESEERYRGFFELCPDAFLIHCQGQIVLINSAGAKLFGANSPADLIGRCVLDFLHPDYQDIVRARIAILDLGGTVGLLEEKIIRLDGTVVDVEVTAGALLYHNQPAVQVIARDISKRKRLQFQKAQITQLSHRLNSATTPRAAAQIIAETAQNLLGWHACTLGLYSSEQDKIVSLLTMDEINGRLQDVPPVNDGAPPTAFDRRVLEQGGCLIQREGADGEELGLTRFGDTNRLSASMLFAPIRNGNRVTGLVSIHSYKKAAYSNDDLALLQSLADHCGGALERLRAQEALRESEERFLAFMNHSPVVAFIKNSSGQYIYGNRAWGLEHKRPVSELLGKSDFDLWPENFARQFRENDAAVLAAGKPLEFTQLTPQDDGSSRCWMVIKFLIEDAHGAKLLGGLALDVTAHKEAEEELNNSRAQLRFLAAHLQSVREEERIRLAREIHDELGQLLTGFKMDLSWLTKRLAGFADNAPLRARLETKIQSMSAMVDDMVDSVRRISTELRPAVLDDLGLVAALEWLMHEFEKRGGCRCHFESNLENHALPPAVCTALFRILQETLTNVARHANSSRVTACLAEKNGNLILSIEDNGRGITPRQLSNPKSLGLAGMRERAMALGGEFQIAGVPRQGTTISVKIPFSHS